jgi:hypothetical protein
MAVNVAGTVAVAAFYLAMLATGIWASWKEKKRGGNTTESVVLAGRNIGLLLGILTMTGTYLFSFRHFGATGFSLRSLNRWRSRAYFGIRPKTQQQYNQT